MRMLPLDNFDEQLSGFEHSILTPNNGSFMFSSQHNFNSTAQEELKGLTPTVQKSLR